MGPTTYPPEHWLHQLRAWLERGDLRGIGAVDVGNGFELPDGEAAVCAMLGALDRYQELPSESRHDPRTQARVRLLLHDLCKVRDQIEARGRGHQRPHANDGLGTVPVNS